MPGHPAAHPLLDERKTPRAGGRALLFVITADRGLCGSFNTNVIKSAGTFIKESVDREVALGLVGRRGRDYFARRGFEVRYEQINLFASLKFADGQAIAHAGIKAFTAGEVDGVYLVYNEFKSVMNQRVVIERLLPIPRGAFSEARRRSAQPVGGQRDRRTISTNRRPRNSSRHCCRRTSRSRCFAPCSNRPRPSTPRA